MSGPLVIATGLAYLWISIEQWIFKANEPLGIIYAGYALANVGFYMSLGK